MSDTLTEADACLDARYRERSPGERIEMALGMFQAALHMARAGVCAAEAGLSEPEVRVRLLARLHGDDLPPAMREERATRTRRAAATPPDE